MRVECFLLFLLCFLPIPCKSASPQLAKAIFRVYKLIRGDRAVRPALEEIGEELLTIGKLIEDRGWLDGDALFSFAPGFFKRKGPRSNEIPSKALELIQGRITGETASQQNQIVPIGGSWNR